MRRVQNSHEIIWKINVECLGFEVLTAMIMKSSIFCDISPCSPLKIKRRFGGRATSFFRFEE
jgi:hypothetical protein